MGFSSMLFINSGDKEDEGVSLFPSTTGPAGDVTVTIDLRLGHMGMTLSSHPDFLGVQVEEVLEFHVAQQAGMGEGDLILEINGVAVDDFSATVDAIDAATDIGGSVVIKYLPKAALQPRVTRIYLRMGKLGLTLKDIPGRGVLVEEASAGGLIEQAGIAQNDVIIALNRMAVDSVSSAVYFVDASSAGKAELEVSYLKDIVARSRKVVKDKKSRKFFRSSTLSDIRRSVRTPRVRGIVTLNEQTAQNGSISSRDRSETETRVVNGMAIRISDQFEKGAARSVVAPAPPALENEKSCGSQRFGDREMSSKSSLISAML